MVKKSKNLFGFVETGKSIHKRTEITFYPHNVIRRDNHKNQMNQGFKRMYLSRKKKEKKETKHEPHYTYN